MRHIFFDRHGWLRDVWFIGLAAVPLLALGLGLLAASEHYRARQCLEGFDARLQPSYSSISGCTVTIDGLRIPAEQLYVSPMRESVR